MVLASIWDAVASLFARFEVTILSSPSRALLSVDVRDISAVMSRCLNGRRLRLKNWSWKKGVRSEVWKFEALRNAIAEVSGKPRA